MKSLLRMVLAEWRKVRGRGLAYAVLLWGALHGLLAAGAIYLSVKVNAQVTDKPIDTADWLMAADTALIFAAFYSNLLVLLVLYALLWAEDHALGTAAMILVRPVRRAQVFAAKLLMSVLLAGASLGLAILVAAGLGLPLFGLTADFAELPSAAPMIGWMSGVPETAPRILRIASGWLAGTATLLPAIGLSALFAALTRSPLLTLAGSLLALAGDWAVSAGLWFWSNLDMDTSELAKDVREWSLFTSRDFLDHHGTATIFADGGADLGRTVGYTLVFLALALLVENRRDVS